MMTVTDVISVTGELFRTVLGLSIVGSYIILLLLPIRWLLRKAPRWCSYLLWGIVFLRLICPVFPETGFSLIPEPLGTEIVSERLNIEDVTESVEGTREEEVAVGLSESEPGHVDVTVIGSDERVGVTEGTGGPEELPGLEFQGILSEEGSGEKRGAVPGNFGAGGQENNGILHVLSVIWLVGAVLFAGFQVHSYLLLKAQVKDASLIEPGVRELSGEHLSFVMGIFKPCIYLSGELDEKSRQVVLCHERVHLKRRDYLIKPAALAICCVHWFNPLVWLAFYLMSKDCETSCDERVIALLGEESKKVYSYALLDEASGGRRKIKGSSVCSLLSFGEDDVKNRVRHVLHYKKASVWILGASVTALAVLAIGLFSDPGREVPGKEVPGKDARHRNEEKERIVAWQTDLGKRFDLETMVFSGSREKDYLYYYDGEKYQPVVSEEISEEAVAEYENGAEVLTELRKDYPDGTFQFLLREQDDSEQLCVNIAEQDSREIIFKHRIYRLEENILVYKTRGDGCYKKSGEVTSEESFEGQIALAYGWQSVEELACQRLSAESALQLYVDEFSAIGYPHEDTVLWVADYTVSMDLAADAEEAVVRFVLENAIPEVYLAEAKVKVNRTGRLYYAQQEAFTLYDKIETRQELEQLYDLEAEIPFSVADTGYSLGFPRHILRCLLENPDEDYYRAYLDPVTAAQTMLHLGEGSGEVTEYLHITLPQNLLRSSWGEGFVVNVRYTFAKDGSAVDIPVVMAEESLGIWALSCGQQPTAEAEQSGAEGQPETAEVYRPLSNDRVRQIYGNYQEEGVYYQTSSFGLYSLGLSGMTCLYPGFFPEDVSLDVYEGMVYFPTDAQYHTVETLMSGPSYGNGSLDWWYNSICAVDPKTGEYYYMPLRKEEQKAFPLKEFKVEGGSVKLISEDGNDSVEISLADRGLVWAGKRAIELNEKERDEYGTFNRQYILERPNTVLSMAHREMNRTFALIDLDGDGKAEEISIEGDESRNPLMGDPMDHHVLRCGGGTEERYASNFENDILVFSPDEERIFIALYEEGPSADPKTSIYKYQGNKLQPAGEFTNDIRRASMENGVISSSVREWTVQTDSIDVKFWMNEQGDLELLEQEYYEYNVQGSLPWDIMLAMELPVHTEPESEETFVIEPQAVEFIALHHSREWVLVKASNGQQGWIRILDGEVADLKKNVTEVFSDLNMAG